MAEYEEIKLVIPVHTPETMPLGRLVEYLQEIAAVMGDVAQDMHLVRLVKSSTKPVFRMAAGPAQRAREQTAAVRTGRGNQQQRNAFNNVRRMVREDGGRPAKLIDRTGVLLNFEPDEALPDVVAAVRQVTSFDGTLRRVGGSGDMIPILMEKLDGEVQSGFSAPRVLAKAMGQLLFDPLRVSGIGNWQRHRDGRWTLSAMLIQAYEPLEDEDLKETFRRLRNAPVKWPANADDVLAAERETN